ncbi:MAG: methyltransferase domain-containing protein [Akkermansiaceae bacterium]|nr:methyltransferase domain-containing protein [Armatimonadota bacterium]
MDEPGCDGVRLVNTYRDFDRVNSAVSGWRGLYTRHVRPVLREVGSGATILDVGCGGGDVLRRLARWASQDGLNPCFVGTDPDHRAIEYARREPGPANLRFLCATAGELATAGERFDIVLSNHVLHHLSDGEVAALCADSTTLATHLAIHADICRHPLAHAGFPLIGGWFRDSFILEDGLLSIRRAFTPEELRRLAPEGWQIRTAFPFRLNLLWNA